MWRIKLAKKAHLKAGEMALRRRRQHQWQYGGSRCSWYGESAAKSCGESG